MLSPEYLKGISEGVAAQFNELEGLIIWDIARRIESTISDPMNLTATAEIQMKIMKEMGYDLKVMREEVAKRLKISKEEIDQIVYDSGRMSYEDDAKLYQAVGKVLPSVEQSAFVSNVIRATQDRLNQDLLNLSNTIGFVEENGKFYGVDDYFKRAMDRAVFQTSTGAFDYQSVTRRIVKEMGASGVRCIYYDSGVVRHFENQIRNNLLTGVAQMAGQISLQNAAEMGQDLMEITAHSGARPTHAVWQGGIVSLSGKSGYLSLADIGYGDVQGFQGANCAHMWFPFFEGVSKRKYTEEELKELGDQSKKYEYNGKMYSEYEAGQKMRQIERSISRTKRELIGLDATNDKDMFTARSVFLRRQRDLYKEFAKISGQPKQDWRFQTYNFDRKKAAQATWANKKLETVANKVYNSGTTKENVDLALQYAKKPFLQNQLTYHIESTLLPGYDVKLIDKGFIPNLTVISNSKAIYSGDEIRVVDKIIEKYGGNTKDWTKKVGKIESDKYVFDVHWYEKNNQQFEAKVKYKGERK